MPVKAKQKTQEKNLRKEKTLNLINRIFGRTLPLLMGEAVLFVVTAVLMMANPGAMLTMATFVIGGCLIVFGLFRVGASFVSSQKTGFGALDVFLGLLSMVLGIVFCVFPHGVALGVVYVFLVLFLLNALRILFFALGLARAKFGNYSRDLIFAGILVLVACLLLVLPNLATGVLVWLLALYLLVYAVADIYMFVKLLRIKRGIVG